MQQAFGLNIRQTLEDVCDPSTLALIVYDMQVGIVRPIANGPEITDRVLQALNAARNDGVRAFFCLSSFFSVCLGFAVFRTCVSSWLGGGVGRVASVREAKESMSYACSTS